MLKSYGTYGYINPVTNKKITAEEIYWFAENLPSLKLYFWGTGQPFFEFQILLISKC